MKYIFWNTNKKTGINQYLEKLLAVYAPDFLGLAEYNANGEALAKAMMAKGLEYAYIPGIGSRLDIFYKGKASKVVHCADSRYYTVKKIPYGRSWQFIVVVHLPSKLYSDNANGNAEILREILADVAQSRAGGVTNKVVLVGDFNMNPFESPLVEATSLQAISSRAMVQRRQSRVFHGRNREFYYNPMWNFLGDEKYPVGSYYYKSPDNAAMYWNTFDQFIVNGELAEDVMVERTKLIDHIDTLQLANENGEPVVSDHFPLYFEIGE